MGLFSRLFERRNLSLVDNKQWREMRVGTPTTAGVKVTAVNALNYSAVYAAVRVLAESIASLPLFVYERLGDEGKRRAPEFYLYRLLHDAPNPIQTSFEFRELMQTHLLLWGNAYAEIAYDANGRATALWPLMSRNMESITRTQDDIEYHYRLPSGELKTLKGWQVLHLRGLGLNGLFGLSPIALARNAIGLGQAAEKFGATFFGNGAQMAGVLKHPMELSEPAVKSLREQWEELYSGLDKAHRIAVLEEGMEYERIGIPPDDAQFLETRKYQTTEIARIYRVPPHMIGDLDRATFSNIEHQSLEFVMHSLRPWLVRWEMTIAERLMTGAEREQYFAEFLVDGLLRGDITSRYAAYATGRQNGWLSANDIRRLENMNPVEGGDIYLVPLNMIPVDQVAPPMPTDEPRSVYDNASTDEEESEARATRSAAGRYRLQRTSLGLFRDTAARILRREANDVGNAANKHLAQRGASDFSDWLDTFYEDHAIFTARQWVPVLRTYAGLVANEVEQETGEQIDEERYTNFMVSYAEMLGKRQSDRSRARLDSILEEFEENALVEIEATMQEWREQRPSGVANEESVRSGNAFAVAIYTMVGVTRLRWVSIGKSCPYCTRLHGKVVAIAQAFIEAGESFADDAPNGALVPSRNIGHAPAHRGCDCQVVSG